jgi:hypothetical protein
MNIASLRKRELKNEPEKKKKLKLKLKKNMNGLTRKRAQFLEEFQLPRGAELVIILLTKL